MNSKVDLRKSSVDEILWIYIGVLQESLFLPNSTGVWHEPQESVITTQVVFFYKWTCWVYFRPGDEKTQRSFTGNHFRSYEPASCAAKLYFCIAFADSAINCKSVTCDRSLYSNPTEEHLSESFKEPWELNFQCWMPLLFQFAAIIQALATKEWFLLDGQILKTMAK